MNETTASPSSSFFNDEERFKQVVGILIAVVTVLTAIVGFLQNDAGARDDRANRQAQEYAFQAMGKRISGAARAGFDRGDAYRNWNELETLALAAENAGDAAAARRYHASAERLKQLSPLLSATYFDPVAGEPNVAKYESDTYLVTVTGLAERSTAWFVVKQTWDGKANTYVVHLTILAVSLFLLGLATTLRSIQVRRIFVAAGLLITLVTLGWVLMVFFAPVPELPDPAIDAYAAGVGLAYQGDPEKALAEFNKALAQAPDYANALFERGNVQYRLGDYQAAVADFEAARAAGRDDPSVAWNLAWLYYLQGRYDESIQTNRQAIEKDPTLLESHFDLALAMLASGQIEAAKAEYAQTLPLAVDIFARANAAGQEPPASLWWSFDEAAASLDGLLDRTEGISDTWWFDTPPLEKIKNPQQVADAAEEIVAQIKGASVALEYTEKPLTGTLAAEISPFSFAQIEYDDDGNFVDYLPATSFPAGINEVVVVFDYEGMQDGQTVVWKVYYNGEEDISWRSAQDWSLGAEGEAEFPLSYAYSDVYTLGSGEYLVEMYVDSHLAQRGYFNIDEETQTSN